MQDFILYLVYKKRIFNLRELQTITGLSKRDIIRSIEFLSQKRGISFINLSTFRSNICKRCPLQSLCKRKNNEARRIDGLFIK